MRTLLGVIALLIVFAFTLTYAMASNALYGSTPADLPEVWDGPCSSGGVAHAHSLGVSNVWDFVAPTGMPQVWLHPDPPETEDTWDFWLPTGMPQVWPHPDPHPDPELWDFYDPSEPIELWDFDVPMDIPHVW